MSEGKAEDVFVRAKIEYTAAAKMALDLQEDLNILLEQLFSRLEEYTPLDQLRLTEQAKAALNEMNRSFDSFKEIELHHRRCASEYVYQEEINANNRAVERLHNLVKNMEWTQSRLESLRQDLKPM